MHRTTWLAATLLVYGLEAAAGECPARAGPHGNDELTVGAPEKLLFRPGGGGFIARDGALGMKFLWTRLVRGPLQVTGRRLDGDAPPLRFHTHAESYGDTGIMPSYLIFPTPGCWEVTGKVRDKPLTFVIWVEKKGEGPSWRQDL